MISFLVLAVVLGVGFLYINGHGQPNGKPEKRRVLLLVEFDPPIRDFNIWVQVSVAGVKVLEDRTKNSPWERTIEVSPGAPVRLTAVQYRTGMMKCLAIGSGAPQARAIDFPGEVVCVVAA
jgi:hypothetical protein